MNLILKRASQKEIFPAKYIFYLIFISLFLSGCSNENTTTKNEIVIGIQADVQTVNPMYAFSLIE